MGLIKAALGSAGGVLADQWKEYFYCDSMAANVLVTKGKKRTSSRSSNTKGSDNIISNGSVIAVNDRAVGDNVLHTLGVTVTSIGYTLLSFYYQHIIGKGITIEILSPLVSHHAADCIFRCSD